MVSMSNTIEHEHVRMIVCHRNFRMPHGGGEDWGERRSVFHSNYLFPNSPPSILDHTVDPVESSI